MTQSKPTGVWTETFRVRSYEVHPNGTLSLPSLCNYFQEAAGNHAHLLSVATDQLTEPNLAWVLSRLRVEIDRYPAWRSDVLFETWPADVDRLHAYRDFEWFDERQPTRLGAGISSWVLIDLGTRRPVRMPDMVTDLHLPDRPRALEASFGRLPHVLEPAAARSFEVCRRDLDLNAHVNNVRFIEWLLEAVPEETWLQEELSMLEIHFRAEVVLGDKVLAACEPLETGPDTVSFAHQLTHADEGHLLATAHSTWRPRPPDVPV